MYATHQIATYILKSLQLQEAALRKQYAQTSKEIGYFFLDDVLPKDVASAVFKAFPNKDDTVLKKSLKENKYVSAQMNKHHTLVESIIFAFQDTRVVDIIGKITGIQNLEPDPNLYAGGISMMGKHSFLNPHLDNSHDKNRERYRALNLLYYVTPQWKEAYGGNLELWNEGPSGTPTVITAKYNRLVIMATHKHSWHSVSKVSYDGFRNCVSNYYFTEKPIDGNENFHVTTFRGRPEEKLKDKWLQIDAFLRMQIRKIFKKGIVENPHVYKRGEE